jgi:membrane protein
MGLRSILRLCSDTITEWNRINAPRLAAAVAFYSMLSVLPLLMISVSVAVLVLGSRTEAQQMVKEMEYLLGPTHGRVVQALGLPVAGISSSEFFTDMAGLIILFFGASGVVVELRDSLNEVWNIAPAACLRSMIRSRVLSFVAIAGIGVFFLILFLLSAAIAVAGRLFSQFLPAPEWVLHLGSEGLSFFASTALFGLLYKALPDTQIEWRDVAVGSAITSALFSMGKFLIGFYVGKAAVGSAYGAAASLVAFLLWVYYSAQIFFLGAVFTRLFAENRGSRAIAEGLASS